MIVVVVLFEFFVFTTPQQSNDPYSQENYDEFNKTPTPAYNYNFSPPISMYHALLIALESGAWNATSLSDMTARVSLECMEFTNSSGFTGSQVLHDVKQPAKDYSPIQINSTTYRYIWDIVVENNVGLQMPPPGLYYVDAATGEIVPTGPLY
jgi:hypothetical protein